MASFAQNRSLLFKPRRVRQTAIAMQSGHMQTIVLRSLNNRVSWTEASSLVTTSPQHVRDKRVTRTVSARTGPHLFWAEHELSILWNRIRAEEGDSLLDLAHRNRASLAFKTSLRAVGCDCSNLAALEAMVRLRPWLTFIRATLRRKCSRRGIDQYGRYLCHGVLGVPLTVPRRPCRSQPAGESRQTIRALVFTLSSSPTSIFWCIVSFLALTDSQAELLAIALHV